MKIQITFTSAENKAEVIDCLRYDADGFAMASQDNFAKVSHLPWEEGLACEKLAQDQRWRGPWLHKLADKLEAADGLTTEITFRERDSIRISSEDLLKETWVEVDSGYEGARAWKPVSHSAAELYSLRYIGDAAEHEQENPSFTAAIMRHTGLNENAAANVSEMFARFAYDFEGMTPAYLDVEAKLYSGDKLHSKWFSKPLNDFLVYIIAFLDCGAIDDEQYKYFVKLRERFSIEMLDRAAYDKEYFSPPFGAEITRGDVSSILELVAEDADRLDEWWDSKWA